MWKFPFNSLKRNIELVLKRDNYTCQKCGSKEQLNIWNNETGDKLKSNKDDLRYCFPLCESCYELETKALGDLNKYSLDMSRSGILPSERKKKYDPSQ